MRLQRRKLHICVGRQVHGMRRGLLPQRIDVRLRKYGQVPDPPPPFLPVQQSDLGREHQQLDVYFCITIEASFFKRKRKKKRFNQ
jgi:hypothetical protein